MGAAYGFSQILTMIIPFLDTGNFVSCVLIFPVFFHFFMLNYHAKRSIP
jgi:hypothetical protein